MDDERLSTKVLGKTGNPRPPNAGIGRPKGMPNKNTSLLKNMLMQALDKAGGVDYLVACAKNKRTAAAFLTLLGKVLPAQMAEGPGDGQRITRIEIVGVAPRAPEVIEMVPRVVDIADARRLK